MRVYTLLLSLAFATFLNSALAERFYVDASRETSGSGASWSQAMKTIEEALAEANIDEITEIWLREGLYPESLSITHPVEIYGGFSGTETAAEQRVRGNHETVIDASEGRETPAHHVIYAADIDSLVLDGLTLQGGVPDPFSYSPLDVGGGLCVYSIPQLEINNCTVQDNGDEGESNCSTRGGGAYIENCSGIISSSQFLNNRSSYYAGICALYSNLSINASVISGNYADMQSSGIFMPYFGGYSTDKGEGGGLGFINSVVDVNNTQIQDNFSTCLGGGLSIEESEVLLRNCRIFDNQAIGKSSSFFQNQTTVTLLGVCGAIYAANSSLHLEKSRVENNKTNFSHPGIGTSNAILQVSNCLLENNASPGSSGALSLSGNSMVANCTFSRNSGSSGSAISGLNQNHTVANCIFFGNIGPALRGAYDMDSVTLKNCVFYENQDGDFITAANVKHFGAAAIMANVQGTSNLLDGDPMFANPDLHNYHLDAGSVAIDAGSVEESPAEDLDGQLRPIDFPGQGPEGTALPDIGCYEEVLVVTEPHKGQVFGYGDRLRVRWDPSMIEGDQVKIVLYHKRNPVWLLKYSTPNDGVFDWLLTINSIFGDDFQVRVRSRSNGASGYMSLPFSIKNLTSADQRWTRYE